VGVARVRAVGNYLDFGQEVHKAARQGGLRSPAPTSYQHSPHLVADGVQQESLLYMVLAHNRGEWENGFFPVQLVPSSLMTPCETEHIGARAFLYLHKLFDPKLAVSFLRTVFATLEMAGHAVRPSFEIEGKPWCSEK
jgi:hypothetical protein